jgi:hypothetical protein
VSRRVEACVSRLDIAPEQAERVLSRDVDECQRVEAEALARWHACPTCQDTAEELAHDCLRRLWFARDYLQLAEIGAPIEDAFPCSGFCGGTGRFNGKTYTDVCYRCDGKGYMTSADRKRCWGYDHFYRKIYA